MNQANRGSVWPRTMVLDWHRSHCMLAQTAVSALDACRQAAGATAWNPVQAIEPRPRLGKVEREYVAGVGKLEDGLLILLDVERLMSGCVKTMVPATPN